MKQRNDTITENFDDVNIPETFIWSFAAVALLHFIGLFWPANYVWGYNFWSVLGKPLSFLFPFLAFILLTPPAVTRLARAGEKMVGPIVKLLKRIPPIPAAVAVSALLLWLFYGLRSEALVYGDGFIRLNDCADKMPPDFSGKVLLEIGATLLPHYFFVAMEPLGLKAAKAFALLNALGGVAAFWALYKIAVCLSGRNISKWYIFFGSLSSGAVLLFFGYIENYTWATAIALWSLYRLLRYLRGEGRIWPALALAVLAGLIHVITLPFLAAALISPALKKESDEQGVPGKLIVRINLLALFISLVTVSVFQLVELPRIFVPLWPESDNPYWILSTAHLLDIFNQLVLVAPLGIIGFVIFLFTYPGRRRTHPPEQALLAILSCLAFLPALWVNPDLGYPRDWDLLSVFGFPLSLWGAYVIARGISGKPTAGTWLTAIIIMTAAVLAPNLLEKGSLPRATTRLDDALWLDAHYQTDYLGGKRCIPWGYILGKNVQDHERAKKYFARSGETGQDNPLALSNLGEAYFYQGNYDSAYAYIKQALEFDTDNPVLNEHLSKAALALDLKNDALIHAEKAVRLNSDRTSALTQLGITLSRLGRSDEAYVYFRRAYEIDPNTMEHCVNLGSVMQDMKAPDSAYAYYMRGQELDPEMFMSNAEMLYKLAIVEQELGKFPDAMKHSHRATVLAPNEVKYQTQLGIILYKTGNNNEAAEQFRRAYRLAPNAYEQVLNLAMISSTLGLYDSAYYYLHEGLRLMGNKDSNPSVTVALFNTCLQLKKYDEARAALETLERMYPGSREIAKLRSQYENALK
ncbi:MAG: tetratricopeptide repeat protein [Candidatus Zixiibacteriota bacterium]